VDTGNTQWVDDSANACKEKELKEQEYHDYTCSGGSCMSSVTNTQWIDTGNTKNKQDGTDCGSDYYDDWVYYCSGDTVRRYRLFHDFYCDGGVCTDHTGLEDQLVENCNNYDGWYYNGDIKEYRDYTCSADSCTYTVTSSENCSTNDGCYVYGDGCEVRDYYRSGDTCVYNYSNRNTDYYDDLVYYCSNDTVLQHRLFHDFYCDNGACTNHTSWVDDQLVENCNDHDGWVNTGTTRWIDDPDDQSKEKEQKEQEYHEYTCSNGSCAYTVTVTQWIDTGNTRVFFSTGPSANPYPSMPGTFNGTIRPNDTITVRKLYTYPCLGTGGHTEYAAISYPNGTVLAAAPWDGYKGDWRDIAFDKQFSLYANETYHYTIRTGSYPQIIHAPEHNATSGKITCTEFVDVNGQRHESWIPAIQLHGD
jgi:hypothetical protein